MTPEQFIAKWSQSTLTERSAAQQHFLDLCELLGVPKPAEVDHDGELYTFEKLAAKESGRVGFADVWYQDHFAWEYKGPNKDLDAALVQVRQYTGALSNPPLLIVSDMRQIRIVSQFTGYVSTTWEIALEDLANPLTLRRLKAAWTDPEAFRPEQTRDAVTLQVAKQFGDIANRLRVKDGADPHKVAQFLIRILFCLFAENNGLLPKKRFSAIVSGFRGTPEGFMRRVADIFKKMAEGGFDANDEIRHFNGDLFIVEPADLIKLQSEDLAILYEATKHDWSNVAPAIFGTLFERGLDPAKRSQIGAHYTSEADIMAVVEPVVMAPLRRKWTATRQALDKLSAQKRAHSPKAETLWKGMLDAIVQTTVLDPACGSGNFLYVTLKLLHDLEFEVITWVIQHTGQRPFPFVSPSQLHGIEINTYAAELARAVIWIGHLQWLIEHGFDPGDPVLRRLDNIVTKDALIDPSLGTKPEWPAVTCIVSNPPFLGGNKVRAELGDGYVEALWRVYGSELGAFADLVCYFVERARADVAAGRVQRVGLITTNSIRGGANRQVLDHLKRTATPSGKVADLFMAWSDREWVLEGAAVRISMLGFDGGDDASRTLDGHLVGAINADLTSAVDLTKAKRLLENAEIAFMGIKKDAPFDIDEERAHAMLSAMGNPNGRPNSDVVKPYINARDVTHQSRRRWIVDFGVDMNMEDAARYELPFEYVKLHVFPILSKNHRASYRDHWWRFPESRPAMRDAIKPISRYIATPIHSKYRLFVWVDKAVIPDHANFIFARDDDYFLGVLHSHAHEVWSLRLGTSLEDRPRYTATTCFETFPFPWPTGAQREAIATAARELVEQRDRWLNPAGATGDELNGRTLTALYNKRPQWLQNAHAALDRAVHDAYGWPADIPDDTVLENLLKENLARARAHLAALPDEIEAISDDGELDDEE